MRPPIPTVGREAVQVMTPEPAIREVGVVDPSD
jgi:hypothetical protein